MFTKHLESKITRICSNLDITVLTARPKDMFRALPLPILLDDFQLLWLQDMGKEKSGLPAACSILGFLARNT